MTNEAMRAAFETQYPNHANSHMQSHHDHLWMNWQRVWEAAAAHAVVKERERCAKVCEDMSFYESPSDCADAIRQGTDPADPAEVAR